MILQGDLSESWVVKGCQDILAVARGGEVKKKRWVTIKAVGIGGGLGLGRSLHKPV